MSVQSDLQLIHGIIDRLHNNPVARLAYTEEAFNSDDADGVDVFDHTAGQNIPNASKTDYNDVIINKGVRTQGASIPRMGWNHYIGRLSYNVNKTIQKLLSFIDTVQAGLAHNANEYDESAKYRTGDFCFVSEVLNDVVIYTWYQRTSKSPNTIANIHPSVKTHWAEAQNKTSLFAQLPFSAPGYRHKFTVFNLTNDSYAADTWYPVTTELNAFNLAEAAEGSTQVLIEAYHKSAGSFVEFTVLSRFTGLAESSTDVVLGDLCHITENGVIRDSMPSSIGYSKLVKGYQAVVWLRGGKKYALWNSYGSNFTLQLDQYNNGVDTAIKPAKARPIEVVPAVLKARVKSTAACESDDTVIKAQIDGALPLPKALRANTNLRNIRTPGVYTAFDLDAANSIIELPVAQPGVFTLMVTGDSEGSAITVQQVFIRDTGEEFTRVLTGAFETVTWYLSSSPLGTDVAVSGLYRFEAHDDGHLYMLYKHGDPVPSFNINSAGHLLAII